MAKVGRPKETKKGESKHPGVKIVPKKRAGRTVYFARWADPVKSRPEPIIGPDGQPMRHPNGRLRTRMKYVWVEKSLDAMGKKTVKARETWCKSKSKNLLAEAAAVAAGETVTSETPVKKALEAYYKSKRSELQPATLKAYLQGTRPFETWCAAHGVAFIESLTPPLLAQYREWFVGRPAHVPAKGKVGKGKRIEGTRPKSPAQENKCLNSLRVVLAQLRREGKLPAFDSDAIVDSLQFVKKERAKRRFLNAQQVNALLEDAQRHDADGHAAIAPFTAACLLTGMRFNELAELTWGEVNAEAGEITLAAKRTKTSTERVVRLDKLPTLWAWLKRGKLASSDDARVFPHLTFTIARMARARLIGGKEGHYNAPAFTWHRLRATCGTYSVCSSLYGRGSEHETALQLGHSIQVAQTHYTGRAKDVLANAESLEAALGCPDRFRSTFAEVSSPTVRTA
ncbi:MAG: tyrosine-type recombinase/integrase [Planctomycetes bacterium]|nr:tyrosine-type recombinase/integrase [Planctomycetota bacterium]